MTNYLLNCHVNIVYGRCILVSHDEKVKLYEAYVYAVSEILEFVV
jgi:hypothetical protein